MKTYGGVRELDGWASVAVTMPGLVDGHRANDYGLEPRRDLVDYGARFDWGNESPGAMQLALALMADLLEDDQQAVKAHAEVCRFCVASLDRESWQIRSYDLACMVRKLPNLRGF